MSEVLMMILLLVQVVMRIKMILIPRKVSRRIDELAVGMGMGMRIGPVTDRRITRPGIRFGRREVLHPVRSVDLGV
jgi:hypothetical protein